MIPDDLYLLILTPCVIPPRLYQGWSVQSREYCKCDGIWLLRLVYKGYCLLPGWLPSFSLLKSSGKANYQDIKILKQSCRGPHGKNLRPLPQTSQKTDSCHQSCEWVSRFVSIFSNSREDLRWLPHLVCNLIRDSGIRPTHLNNSWISEPQKL